LRLASPPGISTGHRRAGSFPRSRGVPRCRPALLQPAEERTRPRRAGDRSRDGGQRTGVGALPREAGIEHHTLIASPLPFAHQPGSGLQLGTRAYPRRSALFELLGKLAELALPFWAQTAGSEFLHPVCDSSQEQFAAEVRRRLGFVECAPLLT